MSKQERTYGSGSGSSHFYVVEARCTFSKPMVYGDLVLDATWRQLPLQQSPCAHVPTRTFTPMADHLRLLNKSAAEAIAYLFLAELDAKMVVGAGCVECRLVEVELEHSYSTKEVGVGHVINRTDGEREKFRPRAEVGDLPLSAREEEALNEQR